jgi:hypothetical protein
VRGTTYYSGFSTLRPTKLFTKTHYRLGFVPLNEPAWTLDFDCRPFP